MLLLLYPGCLFRLVFGQARILTSNFRRGRQKGIIFSVAEMVKRLCAATRAQSHTFVIS